jgi:hypothetical protein
MDKDQYHVGDTLVFLTSVITAIILIWIQL